MGALIAYTIKGAVVLTVLFAAYSLLLSRQKCAALRRTALLAVYILALALPLFDFSSFTANGNSETSVTSADSLISLASGTVAPTPKTGVSFFDIAVAIAAGGIGLLLLWHIACLLYMSSYYFRSSREKIGGIAVRVVKGMKTSPFCFGSTVYVSDRDIETDPGLVLAHESSHASHRHYIDLLIGRSAAIMQWWNPAAWLMLRELRQVHEFQADEDVIDCGVDTKEYQYMLVEMAVGRRLAPLGNGMGQSRLKSRLRMINRESSSLRSRLLTVMLIPAMVFAGCLLSSETLAGVFGKFENTYALSMLRNDSIPTDSKAKRESKAVSLNDGSQKTEHAESMRDNTKEEPIRIVDVSTTAKDVRKTSKPVATDPKSETRQKSDNVSKNGEPTYQVNGKVISDIKSIDPATIKSITVTKKNPDYPNGLIIIELLSPEEMAQKRNSSKTDSIR